MELRQLKYFLSVADTRSFVSAANALYISRQAVSKAIAQLEEELNVELFMRDSSGAFLTPAGMMFYDRVRSIVMELEGVRTQMQAYGTRYHQRIRIGITIGTMPLFEEALLEYRDIQQNAEIVYSECPEHLCSRMLLEQQADVVISTTKIQDPLLITEELLHSRYGILMQNRETMEELTDINIKDLNWVPLAGQQDLFTQDFCSKNGISLQYSGYDYHRLFVLASSGKCALLLPECLIPRHLSNMRWIPIQQAEPWRLYKTFSRSAEKNLLFSAALDDLHSHVFQTIAKKEILP